MDKIANLIAWVTSNGGHLHPSIEIFPDRLTGLSLRVKPSSPALPPNAPIVTLPTALSLSYLSALQQRIFSESFLARTPPHVIGRLLLVREHLRGEQSPWYPYIATLPQPHDRSSWALPAFWPDEERELLEGTNVYVGLEKIRGDVRREVDDAVRSLGRGGNEEERVLGEGLTRELYHWAYCVFSSRSFKPSLVLPREAFEGMKMGMGMPEGVGMDDFSVLLPLLDIGNHDMSAPAEWRVQEDEAGSHRHTCSLVVDRPHSPGSQVFNNYSFKTNAELLLGYGFMLDPSEEMHNDYVHLKKRDGGGEWLVSRRAVRDKSSVVVRAREGRRLDVDIKEDKEDKEEDVMPAFSRVQAGMVWDIFRTLAGDGHEDMKHLDVLSGRVEEGEGWRCLEQTVAVIQDKMLQELERLGEGDFEVEDESGENEGVTGNMRLAMEYRRRCRRVLEGVLETISLDE